MKNPNHQNETTEKADKNPDTDDGFFGCAAFGVIGFPLLPLKKRIFKSDTENNEPDAPQS